MLVLLGRVIVEAEEAEANFHRCLGAELRFCTTHELAGASDLEVVPTCRHSSAGLGKSSYGTSAEDESGNDP